MYRKIIIPILICFILSMMGAKVIHAQMVSLGTEFFVTSFPEHLPDSDEEDPDILNHEFALICKDSALVEFHFFATPADNFSVQLFPGIMKMVWIPRVKASFALGHRGGVIDKRSLRICSDKNISVTHLYALHTGEDATLLYPVAQPYIKTDTLFTITSNSGRQASLWWPAHWGYHSSILVAHYDSVVLEITVPQAMGIYHKNVPFIITLNTGETFSIANDPISTLGLRGARVKVLHSPGNNAISLFTSQDFALVTYPIHQVVGKGAHDFLCEQMLPTSCWDTLYHVVPFFLGASRDSVFSSPVMGILSSRNDNRIFINQRWVTTLGAGQFFDTILSGPTRINSDFPIAVAQFAQCAEDSVARSRFGDPDLLWVNPQKQGIRESIFSIFSHFAAGVPHHPLFPGEIITALTLIKPAAPFPISLNGEDISPRFQYFPADSSYMFAQIPLVDDGINRFHLLSEQKVVAYMSTFRWFGSASYALGDLNPELIEMPGRICEGQSLELKGRNDARHYLWSNGATEQKQSFTEGDTCWVTSYFGCSEVTDTFHLDFVHLDLPLLVDTVLCPATTLTLDVTAEGIQSYKWNTGDTTASIVVQTPGTYIVDVSNDYCRERDSIEIGYYPSLYPVLPDDTLLCRGQYLSLGKIAEQVSYLWNTGDTSCCILVRQPGAYQLQQRTSCDTLKENVRIDFSGCDTCLLIPNAFSPNGDGLNDLFKVISDCRFTYFNMEIYNRLGQLVYHCTSVEQGWNGMHNGRPSDVGVYFYYITATQFFKDDENIVRKGDLTLIR